MSTLRRFSHSLIDTFLDCPRKAEYRYVHDIKSPMTTALLKGKACDEAWNLDLTHKMETGEDLTADELVEVTEGAFRDGVAQAGGVSEVDWGGEDDRKKAARAALDSSLALTRTWLADLAPAIRPTAVQVEYHIELPSGRDFIGFVDYEGEVDGIHAIGDNKTGSRKMAAGDADKALQPYAYAWLKQAPISFAFTRAIDTGKTRSSEIVFTGRSAGDIDWYAGLVTAVEKALVAGIFPPNPKSNLCSPKWCPYFERCQPHRSTHATAQPEETTDAA